MDADTETTLTLEDVAILADGTGNIPDETATRLAPLIRGDERFAAALDDLRRMAADAGTAYLADGFDAHASLERLRAEPWTHPRDVLHPDLDVPYRELVAVAAAAAGRAKGAERMTLREVQQRLERAWAADDPARQRRGLGGRQEAARRRHE